MSHCLVFDVDDPFDQLNACDPGDPDKPCIANVDLVDGDTSGPDNRPTPESPRFYSVPSDADGRASLTLTVSMQPGNNYRAAASVIREAVETQIDQSDADGLGFRGTPPQATANGGFAGYQVPVVWSQMLTVWRKLHVEVDSMAAANYTNTQTGLVPAAPTYNAVNGHAIIPINPLDPEFRKSDQHNVGRIDILTFGSFTTTATTIDPYSVEIINAPPNITNAVGLSYTLWDDDAGSVPPFTMVAFDAPPVVLPRPADTSLMATVYQTAYIEPVVAFPLYYDDDTVFAPNLEGTTATRNKANENTNLTSAPDLWAVHITSALQGYIEKDNDPDDEEGLGGVGLQYGNTIVTGLIWQTSSGSMVYLETIRDHSRGNAAQMQELERYTVVHESGHQFLLIHEDGRSPLGDAIDPAGDYIMTDVLDQTGMAPNIAFSARSLKKIRRISYPPVEN